MFIVTDLVSLTVLIEGHPKTLFLHFPLYVFVDPGPFPGDHVFQQIKIM